MSEARPTPLAAITETRLIDFRAPAIAAAIESVGTSLLALPRDVVLTGLSVHPEAEVIRIVYGHSRTTRDVTQAEIAAVLIAYCTAARIPLPKGARKELKLIPQAVTLTLHTSIARAPRPGGR